MGEKRQHAATSVKRLSVVVPALNEERSLPEVLRRLRETAALIHEKFPDVVDVEIIVVDDGSSDSTPDTVEGSKGVKLIRHPNNLGYGAALKTGFAAARGDWLAFLDADGTYPPEFLVDLVGAMRRTDADIILGSRLAGAGSHMPAVRRLGNKLFALLLSWLTGKRITDTASGMRIFKRNVLERLGRLPDGLDFTPAMSTAALHERLDIREIPMPYDERTGRSKLNPVSDGLRFLFTIVGTAHRYNPLKVFGTLGIVCLGIALAYGLAPLVRYFEVGKVEEWAIYRLSAVMVLAVTGVNLAFYGLVANVLLAAARRADPFRNSLLGRLLLRPSILRRSWALGIVMMIASVVLNRKGIYSYLVHGTVELHWSYLLAGALLFLMGLSFMLWGSLASTLLKTMKSTAGQGPMNHGRTVMTGWDQN